MLVREQNSIRKSWKSNKITIGLIYPNTYRVASTSLGVQLLYFLFNSWEDFICERIFKPINPRITPYSLESQKPLREFDILAISCQFEFDYIQSIELLLKAGINPDVRMRTEDDPLVLLGGPASTANPFPVLFFPDCFFLGDLETVSDELKSALEETSKNKKLEALSLVQGIMAYNYHYTQKGDWIGNRISIPKVKSFSDTFYPLKQIIPENVKGTKNEPILGKAYYLETSRGCSQRCNFCFVGNCRFPRTDRTFNELIKIVDQACELNDFDKFVIYASSMGENQRIGELIEYIIAKGYEVSLPSLRADFLTEDLLRSLKSGKQKTLTLAPETGSEELRFAINKRMSNNQFFTTINNAWKVGFRKLKLYMIYGFPCEGEETDKENIEFLRKIRKDYFPKGRISVSLNQMVTKSQTPFQFAPMMDIKSSKAVQKWYRHNIYKMKNIILSTSAPEWGVIQRILSLRDQRYFDTIIKIAKNRNTIGNWKKILKEKNKSLEDEVQWYYNINDPLPWDPLHSVLEKKALIQAYKKYTKIQNCAKY